MVESLLLLILGLCGVYWALVWLPDKLSVSASKISDPVRREERQAVLSSRRSKLVRLAMAAGASVAAIVGILELTS